MGDRTSLDLIGRQEELVKAMVALGKPVIAFLFNGRPLSINSLSQTCAGDLRVLVSRAGNRARRGRCALWRLQPRRQAAHHHSALRRPSCRFSTTTSRRRGAAICLTMSRRSMRSALASATRAFPSPTRRLTKKKIRRNGSTRVLVDVTNTGNREGTEVVQLYIRDVVSSVTRPVKELKGFRKVRCSRAKARRSPSTSRPLCFRSTT